MSELKPCPRDSAGLVPVTVAGITVDVCPGCHGAWLELGELAALVRRPSELEQAERAAESVEGPKGEPKTGRNLCPGCRTPMETYAYAGDSTIGLDRCAGCGGIWVDDKELGQIELRLENPTARMTSGQVAEFQELTQRHLGAMDRMAAWKSALQTLDQRYGVFGLGYLVDRSGL